MAFVLTREDPESMATLFTDPPSAISVVHHPLGLVLHAYNSRIREAEAGRLPALT